MNERRALYSTLAGLREKLVLLRIKFRKERSCHLEICTQLKTAVRVFKECNREYLIETIRADKIRNKIDKMLNSNAFTKEERDKIQIKIVSNKLSKPVNDVSILTSRKSYSAKRISKLEKEILDVKTSIGLVKQKINDSRKL